MSRLLTRATREHSPNPVVSRFGLAREGSRALQPVEAIVEIGLCAHFRLEGQAPKGPWSLGGPANETETPPPIQEPEE